MVVPHLRPALVVAVVAQEGPLTRRAVRSLHSAVHTRSRPAQMADAPSLYSTVVTGKLRLKKSSGKRKKAAAAGSAGSSAPSAAPAPAARAAGSEAAGISAPARRSRRPRSSEPAKRPRDEPEAAAEAAAGDKPKRTRADEEAEENARATARAEGIVARMSGLTAAQRRMEVLRIKQEGRTERHRIEKSHRERMEELNDKLESLPIHFDVPKVAAAGQG